MSGSAQQTHQAFRQLKTHPPADHSALYERFMTLLLCASTENASNEQTQLFVVFYNVLRCVAQFVFL